MLSYKHKDFKTLIQIVLLLVITSLMVACSGGTIAANSSTPSNANTITSYSIQVPGSSSVATGIVIESDILVTVPFGTNVESLVATFTTNGGSVTVGGVAQVSGTTANNFTNPLTYVVTAADGTTNTYTVTVTLGEADAKAITNYSIQISGSSSVATGIITESNIAVIVPFGTNVTSLVATFTTTGQQVTVATTPQISGITANNFESPVTYVVTAADGTSANYIITVNSTDTYAYFMGAYSVEKCLISPNGSIESSDCSFIYTTSSSNPQGGGIAIVESFAYINNGNADGSNSKLTKCSFDESGSFSNCIQESMVVLPNAPQDFISYNDGFLYIANASTESAIVKCPVSPDGSTISSPCTNLSFNHVTGVAFNQGYAYVFSWAYGYLSCNSSFSATACAESSNLAPAWVLRPSTVAFYQSWVYIASSVDSESSNISRCSVLGDGSFESCSVIAQIQNNNQGIGGMAINGNDLYVMGSFPDSSIYTCQINVTTGSLNCSLGQTSPIVLNNQGEIAFRTIIY